jgi:lipoprotein-anchoring transpeptidase ErfK/SrfK
MAIFLNSFRKSNEGRVFLIAFLAVLAAVLFAMGAGIGLADPPPTPDPTPPAPQPSPPPSPPPEQQPPSQEQPPPPPPPQYPPLPANSGSGRRIVYSQSEMRLWTVEADETVSGSWKVHGRRGWPRAGNYTVFSKSRYARYRNLRWEYMTRFAKGRRRNMGFHSIPTIRGRPIQQESQLGTGRQSGGCVRMAYGNAVRLWDWAPIGTPVVVKR